MNLCNFFSLMRHTAEADRCCMSCRQNECVIAMAISYTSIMIVIICLLPVARTVTICAMKTFHGYKNLYASWDRIGRYAFGISKQ